MRGGKLAGWLALVGSLAALNYASRFSSGKPPADSLYRYDTALSGLVFYALTLSVSWRPETLPVTDTGPVPGSSLNSNERSAKS